MNRNRNSLFVLTKEPSFVSISNFSYMFHSGYVVLSKAIWPLQHTILDENGRWNRLVAFQHVQAQQLYIRELRIMGKSHQLTPLLWARQICIITLDNTFNNGTIMREQTRSITFHLMLNAIIYSRLLCNCTI